MQPVLSGMLRVRSINPDDEVILSWPHSVFRLYVDRNKFLNRHGLTIDLNESQDNKSTKSGAKILNKPFQIHHDVIYFD